MEYKEINQGNKIHHDDCQWRTKDEGKYERIIESCTLNQCESTSTEGYPLYKVPVVISEFTVQIDTESKIKLCEPAIEIKRIKKNVFLNQCRLVSGTKKVFISGFVRKNIEYATMNSCDNKGICGDIKHTTVHVPFKCVVDIKNMREPHFTPNPATLEINYWDDKNMGSNTKEIDMISKEYFNEKVYCELVRSEIHEADIIEECEKLNCLPNEHVFKSFIEKEVIYLTIKLLQNQQVYGEHKSKCKEHDYEDDKNKKWHRPNCEGYDWHDEQCF